MEKLEKVEKLREKTGVTYEEAKNALEACDYDVLDAIVYLEAQGKIDAPKTSSYTTGGDEGSLESESFEKARSSYEDECRRGQMADSFDNFFEGCKRIIKKGWDTKFQVIHEDEIQAEIPVLMLILAAMVGFWILIPLLIVGMFFDYKYKFKEADSDE